MFTFHVTRLVTALALFGTTALVAVKPEPPAKATVALPAPPAKGGGFIFLGEFSNEAELNAHFDPNAEPRSPYRVQLWKDEEAGLVGHVFYPVQEADSPVARVNGAALDKGSGKISFQVRIWSGNSFPENQPQYAIHTFIGFLKGRTLRGTFSRQDESKKYPAVKENVTLKQVSADQQLAPEGIATLAQWEAEYSSLVTGRQP